MITEKVLTSSRMSFIKVMQHKNGVSLTIHDDIVDDTELRLHQGGLLLASACPGAPGPSLCVGLDHQGFLTLPPLLLFQKCPL